MDTVFISSVQTGYEDVRAEVARSVEAVGFRPVMAENQPAASRSPKGALLELVRTSDAMVLILGARYGDARPDETSPTEDEFNEAIRTGKPVLTLVQEGVVREPAQERFLALVRGTWPDGRLSASFTSGADIGLSAVAALRRLERAQALEAVKPWAEERAVELAGRPKNNGGYSPGAPARVVLVGLADGRLISDQQLNGDSLADTLIAAAREVGLIPQRLGVDATIDGTDGVHLQAGSGHSADRVSITLGRRGDLMVEGSAQGPGTFSTLLIDPDRLARLVEDAGRFAQQAWSEIDSSQQITHCCMTIGIPNAHQRVYGRTSGSTLSFGMSPRQPPTVIAPQPPLLARRADLGTDRTTQPLLAAVERAFRDAGATVGLRPPPPTTTRGAEATSPRSSGADAVARDGATVTEPRDAGLTPSVFVSYAHADEKWKDRLATQLLPLQSLGLLDIWDDRRIGAGDQWLEEIESAIQRASVAVLLVSASFLGSPFVNQEEVPALLERRAQEGLRVVPVLLSPCPWQHFDWLRKLQIRPLDARPLSGMRRHNFERALAAVADEIADAIREPPTALGD